MPSAKITYDPEMRKTEHGRRLYAYWRRIQHDTDDPEFVEFPGFYKWAMANGYTVGAKLMRHDEDEPFASDNCYWIPHDEWYGRGHGDSPTKDRDLAREREWDKVVNRIRRHYGMEPIHSSEV